MTRSSGVEQRFKQRLIGAVVLVALGVIFLPMLLSGPVEQTRVDIQLDMPAEPSLDAAPRLPDEPAETAPEPGRALADAPALDGAETTGSAAAPAPVRPDEAPSAAPGFFVQVGAFGSRDNARRLSGRLDDEGLSVRITEDNREDRPRYRVQVGPLETRSQAEAMAQRLATEHDLPGYIVEP